MTKTDMAIPSLRQTDPSNRRKLMMMMKTSIQMKCMVTLRANCLEPQEQCLTKILTNTVTKGRWIITRVMVLAAIKDRDIEFNKPFIID